MGQCACGKLVCQGSKILMYFQCYKRMLENDWILPVIALAQDLGLHCPRI